MIERYLTYLATVRRYSSRTVEIYRGVLEEFAAFASDEAPAAAASGNTATLGTLRGGTASEAQRWGPKDVSGGWLLARDPTKNGS